MISKENFQKAVIQSCRRETSANSGYWSEENPTLGHCATVALLVQDIYGGELLRASLDGTEFAYARSHYWNLLPDGTELDFTEPQFEGKKPDLVGEIRTREYVLSDKQTRQRYNTLRTAFLIKLNQQN